MNNFTKRTLTGAGFVSVLIAGLVFHPIFFYFIFALIIMLGLWEFYGLGKYSKIEAQKFSGMFLGLLVFSASFLNAANVIGSIVFILIIPVIVLISIIELYRHTPKPLENIAYTLFGVIWIAVPFSMFNYLAFFKLHNTELLNNIFDIGRFFDHKLILAFFLLLWSNDTFAYITGVSIGKRRLFERISPKKSWEGFFGGLIMTIVISLILSKYFDFYSMQDAVIIAAIVSVFGTFGDLMESMYKRSIGIKDSGHILPGHGGILDRFDAVLLALPMVFVYIILFAK